MGVITVEKHVLFVEDREDELGRKTLWLRAMRLPWRGSPGKTIGYLHTEQLGTGTQRVGSSRFGEVSPIHLAGRASAMRDFLLGRGQWKHPKLIVAEVSNANYLLSLQDLAKMLVAVGKRKGTLSSDAAPRYPLPRTHEIWLAWDPTQPGKVPPKWGTTLRYAQQVLDGPIRQDIRRSEKGTKTVVGAAYRMVYHQNPPPDVHWIRGMQDVILDHLKQSGVEKGEEWYAVGRYDPTSVDSRFRTRHLPTYTPGRGLTNTADPGDLVVRRLFKVTAPDYASAQRAVHAKIRAMRSRPNLRDMAMDKALAWERMGKKVVTVPSWDVQMGRKTRLDEEFYQRLCHARVY